MPICPSCHKLDTQLGRKCVHCGEAHTIRELAEGETANPILGRLLGGRFAVIAQLGEGAMGQVFEALQLPLGRRVAVKTLHDELGQTGGFRERFEREARATSQLNHPNLVTVYDFGIEDDGLAYIAMEYVDGEPLAAAAPYDHFSFREVSSLALQLLEGVAEAHRLGIIHRDLKPENIILTHSATHGRDLKILDFGLAKMVESDDIKLTRAGEVFGTPVYMSPEQVIGSTEVSHAADIYAFGVILYEMLSGNPPFVAESPMAVMHQHMSAAVPPLVPYRAIREQAESLVPLVMQCLMKDPGERPASADDVLTIFEELLGQTSFPGVRRPALSEQEMARPFSATNVDPLVSPVWLHAPPGEADLNDSLSLVRASIGSQSSISQGAERPIPGANWKTQPPGFLKK